MILLLACDVGEGGKAAGETGVVDSAGPADTGQTRDSADSAADSGDSTSPPDTSSGETGDTGVPPNDTVWAGEAGEGLYGLAIVPDADGAGTPAVVVGAHYRDALDVRLADGTVAGTVAGEGDGAFAMLVTRRGDGVVATARATDELTDAFVLDGPLLDQADVTSARAIVRGLDSDGYDGGFGGGDDVTGDGEDDWLAMDFTLVRVFDGTASGELLPSDSTATLDDGVSAWPKPVSAADLDGDGFGDALVGGGLGTGATVWRGPLAGAYAAGDADLRIGQVGSYAEPCVFVLAAGDVDGDGHLELACDDGGDVRLFAGGGDGLLLREDALAVVSLPARMPWVAAIDADLDGDGSTDLLVGDPTYGDGDYAGAIWQVPGPLLTGPGEPEIHTGAPGDYAGYFLTTGDLDGDGLDDAAAGAPPADDWAGAIYVLWGGR